MKSQSLLCLSPLVLDQSFPRIERDLRLAKSCLVKIFKLLESKKNQLVLTPLLKEFLYDFNYEENLIVSEIATLLHQIVIRNDFRIICDLENVETQTLHPIPVNCGNCGNSEIWAEELGKLFVLHNRVKTGNEFFIGVVCEEKFSDLVSSGYAPIDEPAFPLCGLVEVKDLSDAYDWVIPSEWGGEAPLAKHLEKNFRVIGGTSLTKPAHGSHYNLAGKNIFNGEGWPRPWPFDKGAIGVEAISNNFLRTLSQSSGLSIKVLKFSLVNGQLPSRLLRLNF